MTELYHCKQRQQITRNPNIFVYRLNGHKQYFPTLSPFPRKFFIDFSLRLNMISVGKGFNCHVVCRSRMIGLRCIFFFKLFTARRRVLKARKQEAFKNKLGKGEVLVTSDLFFSQNVFYTLKDRMRHLTLHSINSHFDASTTGLQLLITLWEKKKLLVMSNFSFSHNVFYSDNCTPFVHIFDLIFLFAAELEEP